MILKDNHLRNNFGVIASRPYDYIVLDSKHYQFQEDREVLAAAIEICNLTNILRMINTFYAKTEIKEKIDFSILSKVYNSIFTNEALPKKDLEILFKFTQHIEKIARAMNNISHDLMDQIFIAPSTLMLIIGFGWEKQREFIKLDSTQFEFVSEKFFSLEMMAEENKITIDEFLVQGLELLEYNLDQVRKQS